MKNLERPHIICHMMSTIEGKITSGDGTDILSDEYFDLYTTSENMLPSHTGWMLGRVTMQMFASNETSALPSPTQEVEMTDYIAPHEGNLFLFGVDTKGLLRWDKNAIKLSNVKQPLHLVILVTASTPKEYLQYLKEKGISYIFGGTEELDFLHIFKTMKKSLKVETLLLEGGGLLNGSVMSMNLVDEISLLMTPTVVNQTTAPSVFERKQKEPLNLKHYSLSSVQQLEKDTIWLRYKKS